MKKNIIAWVIMLVLATTWWVYADLTNHTESLVNDVLNAVDDNGNGVPDFLESANPPEVIYTDQLDVSRGTAGDAIDLREGVANGDNKTTLKGQDNQQQNVTVIVLNRDGPLGPPKVETAKTADANLYGNDGEWSVIPISGADTEYNLDDVTNISSGVLTFLSLDANDKYIKPAITDYIKFKKNSTNAWVTLDDGDKLLNTDNGVIWLWRNPDLTGWYAASDEELADGGASAAGWNPGLVGDANCMAIYSFESGALTTDSSGEGYTLNLSGGSPVADTVNYKEGSASVDFESGDSDYYGITGAVDNYAIDTGQAISITTWFKAESSETTNGQIFTKAASTKKFLVFGLNSSSKLYINVDGNDDDTWDGQTVHGTATIDGRWIHVGLAIDFATGVYLVRAWDATAGDFVGTDLTGTLDNGIANEDQNANAIIGGTAGYSLDGNLDEYTIWNKVLTTTDIDQIRAGTYGQ